MPDIDILFSPGWFYGKDILIDVVSVIVLILIAIVTFRYYQMNKKKKEHLLFSGAATLLSIAFISKIMTNFTLYQHVLKTQQFGLLTLTYQTIQYSDILYLGGTFLYRLLTLIGIYVLFSIYYQKQQKPICLIMLFFIFISTYFTFQTYYIFHLTNLLFLTFIVNKFRKNYIKTKDKPAKLIFWSFTIIMLSQLIFIFIGLTKILYVVAEITQLLGYMLLLTSFIMVRRYGKKKK